MQLFAIECSELSPIYHHIGVDRSPRLAMILREEKDQGARNTPSVQEAVEDSKKSSTNLGSGIVEPAHFTLPIPSEELPPP